MCSLILMTLALTIGQVQSEESTAGEEARRKGVASLAATKAKQLRLRIGTAGSETTLREQPLLRWSNPTIGNIYGDVYLWSFEGRPAAIGSIYRWYNPLVKQPTLELVSLTEARLDGFDGDKRLWSSAGPALKFQPLPKAEVPSDVVGNRLGQMRTFSRRFAARLIDERNGEKVTRELRLMNQPVYRYASKDHGIVDGSIFAFVEGTDPEIWLLLEAAQGKSAPRWQYALARMNSSELVVTLDDKELQAFERIEEAWNHPNASYTLINFEPASSD